MQSRCVNNLSWVKISLRNQTLDNILTQHPSLQEAEVLICITEDKQHKVPQASLEISNSSKVHVRRTRGRGSEASGSKMISITSMVTSQQVGTSTFFYIAPEEYPKQATLRIQSNLPRRPWTSEHPSSVQLNKNKTENCLCITKIHQRSRACKQKLIVLFPVYGWP